MPSEGHEGLDVLERYCRQRVVPCEPNSIDMVIVPGRMVTSAGAIGNPPIAEGIGSGREVIDPGHAGASGTRESTGRGRGIPTP